MRVDTFEEALMFVTVPATEHLVFIGRQLHLLVGLFIYFVFMVLLDRHVLARDDAPLSRIPRLSPGQPTHCHVEDLTLASAGSAAGSL